MEKIVSKKPLINESRTIDVPLTFAQLYAINPLNFPKWVVGMKHASKKGQDVKVKDLINTKVDAELQEEGLYVDVIIGKDERSILIKKPTAESGLDFILTEAEKFKIEAVLSLKTLTEESCTAHIEVKLLEAKHKFHPILSFEIKYFFKKSLENFVKESQKAYATLSEKEKAIEAHIIGFYRENVKSLQALIEPLKKDLGEDDYNGIQKELKDLAYDNSETFQSILNTLVSSLPTADLHEAGDKITKTIKDGLDIVHHLSKRSNAVVLADANQVAKSQLEVLKDIVPTVLSSLPTEKIVELQKTIATLLEKNIKTLQDILQNIQSKIPAEDFKTFELGIIKVLKNDLATTKTALDKLTSNNPVLSLEEAEVITNLKKVLEGCETSITDRDTKAYETIFNSLQNLLTKFNANVEETASKVSPENVDKTKALITSATTELFNSLDGILKEATPENLAANKEKFQAKITEILDRYAQAAKLINPELTDEQVNTIKTQIETALTKQYDSFTNKNM
jgi:hypothetical protein